MFRKRDLQVARAIGRIQEQEDELARILDISADLESQRVPMLRWRDHTSKLLQQELGPKISDQFGALWATLPSSRAHEIMDLIRDTANFFNFLKGDLRVHPERYTMAERSYSLNGPFPDTLEQVREELDYWASRQNEGDPGSPWEEGVKNRIEHLTRLEKRHREEGTGPITVRTLNVTGIANLGRIVGDINQSINRVSGMGHKDIAEILQQLVQAVIADQKLSAESRNDAIDNLRTLAEEASAAPEERKAGTVKAILGYLPGVLSASTDVLNYLQIHLVDIKRYFGL